MKQLLYGILILLVAGCKEKYTSPAQSPKTGYLVVEGVVNSGPGTTNIRLSRTTKLDTNAIVYEKGAIVQVQGEDNSVYTLSDQGQGQYTIGNINLNSNTKYRLSIRVSSGKQYLSDYVTVKNNPPIDSISWKRENDNGVQMYINTHDPQNNTLYYQWAYDETWQIRSMYTSTLKYKFVPPTNYSVVYKDSTTFSYDPTIINCWQFNSSTSLLLGSTVKLTSDVVYLPIAFIPRASIKISVVYSINVKQYAWTKEGYAFLEKMKKNTESTGSIFDAQPSELKGNFHSVSDPNEIVVGFFNICPIQEKRIFIYPADVSPWGYDAGCYEIEVENISDSIQKKSFSLYPTVVGKVSPFGSIATFYAAPPECVDCTLKGTNKKPSYMP